MPLRLILEVIPHGDESKKFVAGTLYVENDGTGDGGNFKGIGNYDYVLKGPVSEAPTEPMIPNEFWERGRLEGFERKKGWWRCVSEILNKCQLD